MKRIGQRDTKPEVDLRRLLHAKGLRYRVADRRLPGRPDVSFSRAQIAVFVDGCFWHSCPDHGTLPKNNRAWWEAKLEGNRLRDRAKDAALVALGYAVIHVWEHEDPQRAADTIEQLWTERVPRGSTLRG